MTLDSYVETLRRLGGTELGERAHGLFQVVAAVLAPVALEDAQAAQLGRQLLPQDLQRLALLTRLP
ncbi:hypothetical protein RB199_28135 [Streptomyces libani]